jgi:tetratricopeptide (TPR) repeat protein
MNGSELYTHIMLVGGIVLFLVALVCLFMRYSATLVVTLFILAIIMIGFPRVKSFKVGGAEIDLGELIEQQEKNPGDPAIKMRLEKALVRYNSIKPASVSPQLAEQVARGNEILNKNTLALNWAEVAAEKDPGSTQARELVRRLQLKNVTPASAGKSVSPQEASELTSAVSELSKQPNLSAESHVALSKAQLALGQHEEATANLHQALKQKPNVAVDPKLRALIAATPHQP